MSEKLVLYQVEVSGTFYVTAKDLHEANAQGEHYLREAASNHEIETWASEITGTHVKYIDRDTLDSLPYGKNPSEWTVAQFINPDAPPPPDERKGPVHWCDGCTIERVQFDWRKDRQLCQECEEALVPA